MKTTQLDEMTTTEMKVKIIELEKQLQDCLNPEEKRNGKERKRTVRFNRVYDKAQDIIRGTLDLDGYSDRVDAWQDFRDHLISFEPLKDFWQSKKFRWGFYLICKLIDDLIILNYDYDHGKSSEDNNELRKANITERFIGDCIQGDESDRESILELSAALETIMQIKPEEEWELVPEDVYDIKADLETIARCQLMVLEVVRAEAQ